ncbi:hypothetical protein ACH5RR_012942 [Cinchona calisaya]|uniref:Uncharacterized protein n=1 Tax=Cinchona calisaya TaxID=153742 RepID=A0ABD2ZYM9_9GENT
MASRNTQVSSKVARKSSSNARSDNASSVGPWTRSKSKMQAMVIGASSVEEKLESMARTVEKLSKIIEEKDMQIAALV